MVWIEECSYTSRLLLNKLNRYVDKNWLRWSKVSVILSYEIIPNAAFRSGVACFFNLGISKATNIAHVLTAFMGYSLYPEVRIYFINCKNNIVLHLNCTGYIYEDQIKLDVIESVGA